MWGVSTPSYSNWTSGILESQLLKIQAHNFSRTGEKADWKTNHLLRACSPLTIARLLWRQHARLPVSKMNLNSQNWNFFKYNTFPWSYKFIEGKLLPQNFNAKHNPEISSNTTLFPGPTSSFSVQKIKSSSSNFRNSQIAKVFLLIIISGENIISIIFSFPSSSIYCNFKLFWTFDSFENLDRTSN